MPLPPLSDHPMQEPLSRGIMLPPILHRANPTLRFRDTDLMKIIQGRDITLKGWLVHQQNLSLAGEPHPRWGTDASRAHDNRVVHQ
jgi:hypothetical protein